MQPFVFCDRCRGLRVGWNRRYLLHYLVCKDMVVASSKLLVLMPVLVVMLFTFPTAGTVVFSDFSPKEIVLEAEPEDSPNTSTVPDPAVRSIEGFLKRYAVNESVRERVAESIVDSARKHNLDPKLIASVMIVESRANPFAISPSDSIGVMQIHLPTWGKTADREGINLFKIEDNVDFGTRILKDYVKEFGLWDGVKRYKGWTSDSPESQQAVLEYVTKVRRVYGLDPQPPSSE
jgi:transglycosylase-like protein with SLT domain